LNGLGASSRLAKRFFEGSLTAAQVADASPGYLLLHTLLAPQTIRILQAGLGGFAIWLLFLIVHRRIGAVAAFVGASALAFGQPWVLYSSVMEPETLIGVCLLSATAALTWRKDASTPFLLFAACCLGIASSLRPTALLFIGLVALRLLVLRSGFARSLLVATCALGVVLMPAMWLQLRAGHDLRGTMSIGQVFHQSHAPESLGFGAVFPSLLKGVESELATGAHTPDAAHELYRAMARATDPTLKSDASTELFWVRQAAHFARQYPEAIARQVAMNLLAARSPANTGCDEASSIGWRNENEAPWPMV